jgi:hypothetical protein
MRYELNLLMLIFFAGFFQLHAGDKEAKVKDVTFEHWLVLLTNGYAWALQHGSEKKPSGSDLHVTTRTLAEMKRIKDQLINNGKNQKEDFIKASTQFFAQQEKDKNKKIDTGD